MHGIFDIWVFRQEPSSTISNPILRFPSGWAFPLAFPRSHRIHILAILAISLWSSSVFGQAIDEQGVKPYGSYHVGEVDMVALQSAKLEAHIPLIEYKQRGGRLQLGFNVRYRSAMWNETKSCGIPRQPCILVWQGGAKMEMVWDPGLPTIQDQQSCGSTSCVTVSHTIVLGDGSQHEVGFMNGANSTKFEAVDATGLKWDSSAQTITMADGTRYSGIFGGTPILEDANGNQILFNLNGGVITDTFGRNISIGSTSTSDFSGCTGPLPIVSASLWTVPGANGSTNTFKFCNANVQVFTHHFSIDDSHHIEPNGPQLMLQSIVLPEQTTWTFEYTQPDASGVNWGDLAKITYPTGASVSYTWAHFTGCHNPIGFLGSTAEVITSRTVDANDGTGPHQWSYSLSSSWSNGIFLSETVTISDPMGNDTTHFISDLSGCSLYETQTQYFSGTGTSRTLLKTVNTDYSSSANPNFVTNTPAINVVPIRKTTILPNGQQTKTEYSYDSGFSYTDYSGTHTFFATYGKQTSVEDYDFGSGAPGALLRSTQTSYLWQGNSQYINFNVLNVPSNIQVFDSSGNTVAQTATTYDDVLTTSSGINTSLDLNPPNGNVRGNATSQGHWLNSSSVSTSSCPVAITNGFLTSTARYFDTGNLNQSTDPCGHTTTTQYSSAYAGALPTSICDALNHCNTMSYDSNTAALASITDPNNQVTSSAYDNFGRLTQIDYPDSGEADFFYPDPSTVEKKIVIDRAAGLWADGFFYFDGLGRAHQRQQIVPSGTAIVDTIFDADGNLATVSNPYFSTNDPTYGAVTNEYDALGRVIQSTKQDGSISSVQYDVASAGPANGDCHVTTDEAGKKRTACIDALGRLIATFEDPSGLNYETDYQYDVVGNLIRVDQKGSAPADSTQWRTRLFTYDSLSRLLTATNPESGTLTYAYDADGSVITKMDARNVITSYTYDALHRLTLKSYSDSKTSAAHFLYDVPSNWGYTITNVIGRLSEAYIDTCPDGSGNKSGGNSVFSYDAMGRVILNAQSTPSNCGTSAWPVTATYNLAGNMSSLTYPSGRYVTFRYNSGNELNQVQFAQMQGIAQYYNPYNYWSTADTNFYPTGAPKSATLGSGLVESYQFNSRLQPTRDTVAIPSGNTFADHLYGYATQNNGNLMSLTDQLNAAYTQSFTYDSLNRLASAMETRWGMNYVYDAWGNYLQQNLTLGTGFQHQYVALSNNRLSSYSYDGAGNMLNDGLHQYVYDGENRIVQVDPGALPTASYGYDANGNRVRKDAGANYAEYIYFGGKVIAEHNQDGSWSDYIFANGKRIAKADNIEHQIHLDGQVCSNCGTQTYSYTFNSIGIMGARIVQAGDTLRWQQWQNTGSVGGIVISYSDGSKSTSLGSVSNQWQSLSIAPTVGKTISSVSLYEDYTTQPGTWDLYYQYIVFGTAAGVVQPLFSQNPIVPVMTGSGTSGETGVTASINICSGVGCSPLFTTTYYHADQIGSSRLLTNGQGYPVWQGTFLPYGEEYNPQITTNHYKFAGKERDAETGLDVMGRRYHASAMGRLMTPDPLMLQKQKLFDPQQWNMYQYARNNPVNFLDPTGLYVCNGTKDQCDAIRTALENVKKAADTLTANDPGKAKLDKILKLYGKEGDKGVNVTFGTFNGKKEADTGRHFALRFIPTKTIDIKFDLNQMHKDFSNRSDGSSEEVEVAATVAHEGQHGVNTLAGLPYHGFEAIKREETSAFDAQSYVNKGLNKNSAYGVWNPIWPAFDALVPFASEVFRQNGVQKAGEDEARSICKDPC